MALPIIDSPTFEMTLPSQNIPIKFRPFKTKEEKILLMAMQSGEEKDVINATEQIINNCLITDIDINNLPSYDIEYIFKELRAKTVGDKVEIKVIDPDDQQEYDTIIDLNAVNVEFDPEHNYTIRLNDQVTLMMKDPPYKDIIKVQLVDNEVDRIFELIKKCIDKVLVGDDEVLYLHEHTKEEQDTFLESFSHEHLEKIKKFTDTIPKLKHTVKYKKEDGTTGERELEGLDNFFTF